MKNRLCFVSRLCLVFTISLTAHAESPGLKTPEAPAVRVVGEPGTAEACYWVVAADKPVSNGGSITNISAPTHLQNLPAELNDHNFIEIDIKPVEGAGIYYVLKTMPWREPTPVSIDVANPGEQTYYYWIVTANGFRNSTMFGPYPAENCGDPKGNSIRWSRTPEASFYYLYRTSSPEPPVGRGEYVVAAMVGGPANGIDLRWLGETEFTDTGRVFDGVTGLPETPIDLAPLGNGQFLVAQTRGEPVIDRGDAPTPFTVDSINQTSREPAMKFAGSEPSIVKKAHYDFRAEFSPRHMNTPSFGNAFISNVNMDQTVHSGGHSEYELYAGGMPGWKSSMVNLMLSQNLHTRSQSHTLYGVQRSYGTGDTIYSFMSTLQEGANWDNGDEGAYVLRTQTSRQLVMTDETLTSDAPRGSITLRVAKTHQGERAPMGSGRLVVNRSIAQSTGRIQSVDNCTIYGKETNWSEDLVGSWISFDVDNVNNVSSEADPHRNWYLIREVNGPEKLTIMARTRWSKSANLGYSRFIYNPDDGAAKPDLASKSIRQLPALPADREEAARSGGYLINAGVLFSNPWRHDELGMEWHCEPLIQTWNAGDDIRVVAGPQAYLSTQLSYVTGSYLPQDHVEGFSLYNLGSRPANGPGISVGHSTGENYYQGINIALAKDGYGDGLVIDAGSGWDAAGNPSGNVGVRRGAIVVPQDLPAIAGTNPGQSPTLSLQSATHQTPGAIQIASQTGTEIATFDLSGKTRLNHLELKGAMTGNNSTRDKAVFDGDGKRTSFHIVFKNKMESEPFVLVSTNQFAAHRLIEVQATGFIIEFQEAPVSGNENVEIFWFAQQ